MSKSMKYTAFALLALAVLALATVLGGSLLGERKMARTIHVTVAPVPVPTGLAAIEHGRYLFSTRGCADCHGANGSGREVFNSPGMLVRSPNITQGEVSATAHYRAEDWVRTLRHGVKPDGRPVMIMPSEDFSGMPDEDIGALIAYIGTLAPAPGRLGTVQLPLMVRVMYAFGMVRDAAELIDHTRPPAAPVPAQVSLAHGAYVANSCVSCHGPGFSGGRIPGAPAEWPAPANLTPGAGSVMVRYPTPELFMAMLRSGHRPDGTPISAVMPFASLGQLNDTDVRALHRYLLSLPPRAHGQR